MKQLPKASDIIYKYFLYNEFDKKIVSEMMQEYTRLVLDYVAENATIDHYPKEPPYDPIVDKESILKIKDQLS